MKWLRTLRTYWDVLTMYWWTPRTPTDAEAAEMDAMMRRILGPEEYAASQARRSAAKAQEPPHNQP